jgi:Ca2+-binding RTX toxin-like protein
LANSLVGSEGNNLLDGGIGADSLTGGSGEDTFAFSSKLGAKNIDVVTDFFDDKFALDKRIFKSLKVGITEENFVVGSAPLEKDDFLFYHNGTLYYDPDGSGVKAATAFVTVVGAPVLAVDDFSVL